MTISCSLAETNQSNKQSLLIIIIEYKKSFKLVLFVIGCDDDIFFLHSWNGYFDCLQLRINFHENHHSSRVKTVSLQCSGQNSFLALVSPYPTIIVFSQIFYLALYSIYMKFIPSMKYQVSGHKLAC